MKQNSSPAPGGTSSKYPIAYAFAGIALAALLLLALLRHFFGSIRVEAGTR